VYFFVSLLVLSTIIKQSDTIVQASRP